MIQYRCRDICTENCGYLTGTMKFTALLFLTLIPTLLTQTASIVMKAAVGETITVECSQAAQYQGYSYIIWCKATSKTNCNPVVSTQNHQIKKSNGTTSIATTNGLSSVTIQQLQEIDTGTYWCVGDFQGSFHVLDVILLKVLSDSWKPARPEISGVRGNIATVPCLYTDKEIRYKKFLCKVTSVNKCTIIASSDGNLGNLYNGSVAIITNNSHNLTITMSNFSKGDEGEYWCGAVKVVDIKIVQVKNLTIAEGNPTVFSDAPRDITPQTWYIILTVFLGLLILLLLVLFILRKKRLRPAKAEGKNENPESPTLTSKFDREAEDMVIYSTVTIEPSDQTKGNSTTYANLEDLKEQQGSTKISSSETVEYSALAFRS
ncbi:polymeric immunoglobulin receptor-like [Carcharodon carcharias]|uniref:polymeric immunoglobulin receptor-like n=1 Tax=Carcharodon carcharias TaxID=13397 RepID=UPI001B7EFE6B|nr:polymeric immunoglobulin receptor-like [Carcharodon carcharias]